MIVSACLFRVEAAGANETALLTARAGPCPVDWGGFGGPPGGGVAGRGGSCRWTRCRRTVEQEHVTGSFSVLAPSRVPEAVVADFVQTFGQHVLQEAAHELVAAQAGGP